MLGELYRPKGLALETARAVLEVEDPFAVNVALGCSNQCAYCYVPKFMHTPIPDAYLIRKPKKPPVDLVHTQLEELERKGKKMPEGVFLSFLTDPFLHENEDVTDFLIEMLRLEFDIKVATLSKMGVSLLTGVRHGVTVVSFDAQFWKQYEPKALHPVFRLSKLKDRGFGWVSVEPYPPSAIYKQDFDSFLEHFKNADVNLIVFGMWNYDKRAKTEEARREYADDIWVLTDFCKKNGIRLHVKSDTLKFVEALNG